VRKSELRLAAEIAAQVRWIEEHGGTMAGYVRRYGSRDDPHHYGDGGEAIYHADTDALSRLFQTGRRWR